MIWKTLLRVRHIWFNTTTISSSHSKTSLLRQGFQTMSSGSKPVVAAGFIIFRKTQSDPEYLLLQTSYGHNHWTPPKGHVDPGESEFETALRETEEEAGVTKDQMHVMEDFQRTLNYQVNGKPKRVVYWLSELCNPKDTIKLSDEHIDFKWNSLDGACELAQFPDMVTLLKEVDEFLKSAS